MSSAEPEDGPRLPAADADRMIDLGHEIFVPVAIDAARELDGVAMLRATYFIVTTDAPASIWEIDLPPLAQLHGLGALGMLGVVFSTMRASESDGQEVTRFDVFADPHDVASIFGLEDEDKLSIHLEDIWLPEDWCEEAPIWGSGLEGDEAIARGDVLRVGIGIFRQAYRYATGDIDVDDLLGEDVTGQIYRSPRETAALRYWADDQIETSKRAFQEAASEYQLEWSSDG